MESPRIISRISAAWAGAAPKAATTATASDWRQSHLRPYAEAKLEYRIPMDALHAADAAQRSMPAPLIEARGLGFKVRAGAGEINILRGLDLRVNAGEAVGIVGPSGSGKTSLLMLLAGMIPPPLLLLVVVVMLPACRCCGGE